VLLFIFGFVSQVVSLALSPSVCVGRQREGGEETGRTKRGRTRTVLSTDDRRGKSCTPAPRVATDDSRKESDVRSDATQSP
jgi:hypothetical protein